ncbi:MAG: flagellar biosynthetic protein FliR [Fibrobacteres bacterium]|nr:flagellar biosynthetic protein FliR [Fibrobacterota bacterium]
MQTFADISVDQILLLLIAFVRMATMIVVFPVIGSRATPTSVKAGLAVFLTVAIFPTLPPSTVVIPTGVFSFAILVAKEVMVGLLLGFIGSILFEIVQMGSKLIDMQMGFAMAETVDPLTDQPVTPIAQLTSIIFTLIFLLMGGHHMIIKVAARVFEIIPIGAVYYREGPISLVLMRATGDLFSLGFRFAAPVLVALIIVTVALGIIAKTVPQLNIFMVGMPLQIGLGFFMITVALPSMIVFFEYLMERMINDMNSITLLLRPA